MFQEAWVVDRLDHHHDNHYNLLIVNKNNNIVQKEKQRSGKERNENEFSVCHRVMIFSLFSFHMIVSYLDCTIHLKHFLWRTLVFSIDINIRFMIAYLLGISHIFRYNSTEFHLGSHNTNN